MPAVTPLFTKRPKLKPGAPAAVESAPSRLPALDALRALAMLSVVSFHAIQIALQHRPAELDLHTGAQAYLWATHAWRMPAFFLISGFFTDLLIDRRGPHGAWNNRRRRLLYPLIVSLVVILPLSLISMESYHAVSAEPWQSESWRAVLENTAENFIHHPTFRHLWFLVYLFTMATAWIVTCMARARIRTTLPASLALPLLILAQVVLMASMRSPFQMNTPTAPSALLRPFTWFLLFTFFIAGAGLYRRYATTKRLPTHWKVAALVVIAFATAIALRPDFFLPISGHATATRFDRIGAAILMTGFMSSGVYFLLAFFNVYVRAAGWMVRSLITASFFTYLVHYPLIYGIGAALGTARWPYWREATALTLLAYATCFGVYFSIVRGTWLDRFLNGGPETKNT